MRGHLAHLARPRQPTTPTDTPRCNASSPPRAAPTHRPTSGEPANRHLAQLGEKVDPARRPSGVKGLLSTHHVYTLPLGAGRPLPRVDSAKGLFAEMGSDLLLAKLPYRAAVDGGML